MDYKRLEVYVGWTCNHKCTYCKEFPNMEVMWNKRVTKYEILKLLLSYKKQGYNHVSYLGGEPLIQGVFYDALLLGRKFGYTILVTTNCTTLHLQKQAEKFLPYIDELILSVQGITKEQQNKISRTNSFVNWEEVFLNIKKYWNGKMLKVNTVITKDNLPILKDIVEYVYSKGIKDIAISYPDIDYDYYGKDHILDKISPRYSECMEQILPIIDFCRKNNIRLKLPDFPFCVFPQDDVENYIPYTDDYDYETRINMFRNKVVQDRGDLSLQNMIPRERTHVNRCKKCKYINECWGVSKAYQKLYNLDEINPIH